MPPHDSFHVLIVSFRRPLMLRRCLLSVSRHVPNHRVHVWDNASEDSEDIRRLASEWPQVRWTFHPTNIGFARAVNALSEQCDGNFLLLNPDAVLVGSLSRSAEVLRRPGVAAAAPRWSGVSKGADWDVAHRPIGPVRALVSHAGYSGKLRGSPLSDLYRKPPVGSVGYLTGACLLINRAAWLEVGPFDEQFFLYSEEVDWARRARTLGWQLRLSDERAVKHEAFGTVSDDPVGRSASGRLLVTSQEIYLRKHFPLVAPAFASVRGFLDRHQRSKR